MKQPIVCLLCLALLSAFGCGEAIQRNPDGSTQLPPGSGASSSSSSSSSTSGGPSSDNGSTMAVQHYAPASGSSRTALVSTIQVTFTQPVLDNSFDNTLITVFSGDGVIEGELKQLSSQIFEFVPDNNLPPTTEFQVLVGDIMSASGEEHAGFQWTFTTPGDIGNTSQSVIDSCMNDLDIRMLAAVNMARSKARSCGSDNMPAVASLSWHCELRKAAQTHSDDMARNNFFSHTGSNGSSAGDRVTDTHYSWSSVRENLAAGQRDVEEVMAGLLDSPGHCVNIMARDVVHFGFGFTENEGSRYRRYWTQVFAAPWR